MGRGMRRGGCWLQRNHCGYFFFFNTFFCVHWLSQFLWYHQASILFTGEVLCRSTVSAVGVWQLCTWRPEKNQLKCNNWMAAQNSNRCQKLNSLKLICSVSVMVKLDFHGLNLKTKKNFFFYLFWVIAVYILEQYKTWTHLWYFNLKKGSQTLHLLYTSIAAAHCVPVVCKNRSSSPT